MLHSVRLSIDESHKCASQEQQATVSGNMTSFNIVHEFFTNLENSRYNFTLLSNSPSIESNSIQRRMENTQQVSYSKALKRVFLSNRTVTCNDGSQAGFYLRKSPGSRRWVVFFEGGWHCYDHKSCRARWMKLRHLMTSAQWQETRDGELLIS